MGNSIKRLLKLHTDDWTLRPMTESEQGQESLPEGAQLALEVGGAVIYASPKEVAEAMLEVEQQKRQLKCAGDGNFYVYGDPVDVCEGCPACKPENYQ